jgi:hypothetical protein
MTHEAFNEYGMTAINKSMQGIVQNIEKFVALIQKIPLIFIFNCVELLFLLFIAYMAFNTAGGVNRILTGK